MIGQLAVLLDLLVVHQPNIQQIFKLHEKFFDSIQQVMPKTCSFNKLKEFAGCVLFPIKRLTLHWVCEKRFTIF